MTETPNDLSTINPDRLYTTTEVAGILDMHPDTVYRIPRSMLRRTQLGPKRGRTKIRGSDLLAYIAGERGAA